MEYRLALLPGSKKVSGSTLDWDVTMLSLHVRPVPAWIFPRTSFPRPKTCMFVRILVTKLSLSVRESVNGCLCCSCLLCPCDGPAASPMCTLLEMMMDGHKETPELLLWLFVLVDPIWPPFSKFLLAPLAISATFVAELLVKYLPNHRTNVNDLSESND